MRPFKFASLLPHMDRYRYSYRYFVCATNSVLDKWEYLRVFPMVSDDINELGVFPVKFYYVLKKEL